MDCFTRCSRNPYCDLRDPRDPFNRTFILPATSAATCVKRKLSFPFYWLLAILLFAFSLQHATAHADGIDIQQAHLESSDEGYRLSASYEFDLNRGLEDALTRGIPLYFTTEIEITRPRWYWFDAREIVSSQTIRISYNVLTRQYYASMGNRLHQNFDSLDDALSMVRRPNRWVVADKNALKPGTTYEVAVRMQLDVAQLPKPFQVHALNSSDWRLSSDWERFDFTAD